MPDMGPLRPFLNPAVWRYAILDAADGAMIWRGDRGEIVAFNIVHRSGIEGWMGPLAVRSEHQGAGAGKEIVRRGVEWLKVHGASTPPLVQYRAASDRRIASLSRATAREKKPGR